MIECVVLEDPLVQEHHPNARGYIENHSIETVQRLLGNAHVTPLHPLSGVI
jgi:hypothetical protein